MGPIRVFLVDDHEIVRRGVARLLRTEPDLVVAGEASTAAAARVGVHAAQPDVALLDVRLPDGNGIDLCRGLGRLSPAVRCLIFTSFEDDEALVDAAGAGAAGYILKRVAGSELVAAMRHVAAGGTLLDQATTRMALRRLREDGRGLIRDLAPQKRRVLELIGDGRSNRQIAAEMTLTEKTVKNYVAILLDELAMSSRTEAAAFFARIDERRRLALAGAAS